ncbi:hypothetical protein ACFQ60_38570 [Streptomyces zhihengii]
MLGRPSLDGTAMTLRFGVVGADRTLVLTLPRAPVTSPSCGPGGPPPHRERTATGTGTCGRCGAGGGGTGRRRRRCHARVLDGEGVAPRSRHRACGRRLGGRRDGTHRRRPGGGPGKRLLRVGAARAPCCGSCPSRAAGWTPRPDDRPPPSPAGRWSSGHAPHGSGSSGAPPARRTPPRWPCRRSAPSSPCPGTAARSWTCPST